MTYITKMARARAAIEAFNASQQTEVISTGAGPGSGTISIGIKVDCSKLINADKVEAHLRDIGAVTEDTLIHVSWEDILDCCNDMPKLLAKQIASIFRSQESSDPVNYVSPKKAARMNFEELFRAYQPREDNEISKKLAELSKGKRVVVFDDPVSLAVNIQTSTRLLQDIRSGFPEISVTANAQGRPCQIYKVGDVPDDKVDENPLYPGRPLRGDATCDQTLRSWKGISPTIRQLVFLATTKTGEARRLTVNDANDLMDLCLEPLAEEKLRRRWFQAGLMLDDLAANGQAPRLKLKINSSPATVQDPFYRT